MEQLRARIRQFLADRDWTDLRPGDIAKSISIEAAELLEVFQWNNPDAENTRTCGEVMERLKAEASDILIYLLELSVVLEFDLLAECEMKVAKIEEKYPPDLMKRNRSQSSPTNQDYMEIKKRTREGC